MKEIISWYNTKKKSIWRTITIVASILILIRVLNSLAGISLREKQNRNITTTEKKITTNSIIIEGEESTVSGEELSSEQKNMLKALDQFGQYCINGEIDKAYNLLSDECKEEMYRSEEYFKSAYYDNVFKGERKDISVENWVGNTYKVRFIEDALSTGAYDKGSATQDYITIVKDENGENRLNINGYIGREKLNVSGTTGAVTIKAIETNIYMNYQTFTYEIANKSDKKIMLYEPNILETMYISDDKEIKYEPYMNELSKADLQIMPYETRKLTMKYYNKYVSSKIIKNIVFKRIILDYERYAIPGDYYYNYGIINIEI